MKIQDNVNTSSTINAWMDSEEQLIFKTAVVYVSANVVGLNYKNKLTGTKEKQSQY